MRTRATAAVTTALIVLALGAAGCGSGTADDAGASAEGSAGGKVTVFAAASLKATFNDLGTTFEDAHPGVTLSFNFAGSQTLVEQITQGAPADVFASANEATMTTVTDAGLNAAEPVVFATNQLTIAVPPENPADIDSFQDLADPGVQLVVCAPEVPCGAATAKIEKSTGVTLSPVSEELAVTDVLAKVRSGEADAGLVYQTDVIAAGDTVKGIDFPESADAVNSNSITAIKDGPQVALGQQFVDLVLSAHGQQVLAAAGFGAAK